MRKLTQPELEAEAWHRVHGVPDERQWLKPADVVAYVADAFILVTYFLLALRGWSVWWFNLANAVGGIPLLVIEWRQRAYPVMPLTATFTAIGWLGLCGVTL